MIGLTSIPHSLMSISRFILHVWDTKPNLMRYIYNSNATRATVNIPICTKMYVKVEMQVGGWKYVCTGTNPV